MIFFSDSSKSSNRSSPKILSSCLLLQFLINRKTHARQFRSRFQLENVSGSVQSTLHLYPQLKFESVVKNVSPATSFSCTDRLNSRYVELCFRRSSSSTFILVLGHLSSLSLRKSGPSHHSFPSTNLFTEVPRDIISAGFSLLGKYFH